MPSSALPSAPPLLVISYVFAHLFAITKVGCTFSDIESAKIALVPAADPFTGVDFDKNETMLLEVEVPANDDIFCTLASGHNDCGGIFSMDLSASNQLEVLFKLPLGDELEMEAMDGGIILEFHASNTNDTIVCDTTQKFEVGDSFTNTLTGSNLAWLTIDAQNSFTEISACDIHISLQFVGPPDTSFRVEEIYGSVPQYDPNLILGGVQSYKYKMSSSSWIKAHNPTLVEKPLSLDTDGSKGPGASSSLVDSAATKLRYTSMAACLGFTTAITLAVSSVSFVTGVLSVS